MIQGTPKPRVRWFYQYSSKEVSEIEAGDTIFIRNLQPDDAGTYRCEAVNAAGEDYHYTDLIYECENLAFFICIFLYKIHPFLPLMCR